MNKKLLSIFIFLDLIIIVLSLLSLFFLSDRSLGQPGGSELDESLPRKIEAGLPWVENALTQPLPLNASKTRLSLPAKLEDLMPKGAPITGFGAHVGQHVEGLDHVWISVKQGEPARAWADGKVTDIEKIHSGEEKEKAEYMVYLDYGDGLTCSFGEIYQPLVKKGQTVKYLDPIGEIGNFMEFDASEIEVYCNDAHRYDGVVQSSNLMPGSAVSPFDYLNDQDKAALEAAYLKKVIEPYLADKRDYGQGWYPVDPFLTNRTMVHEEGKITGEWFLINKKWNTSDPSLVVFLPCQNQYCENDAVRLRSESVDLAIGTLYIDGIYRVAYENGLAKITLKDTFNTYYALAEVIEDAGTDSNGEKRAQMKFEFSRQPIKEFSNRANLYQERGIFNPRYDAWKLGHWSN